MRRSFTDGASTSCAPFGVDQPEVWDLADQSFR
jgi:hypothetical protein